MTTQLVLIRQNLILRFGWIFLCLTFAECNGQTPIPNKDNLSAPMRFRELLLTNNHIIEHQDEPILISKTQVATIKSFLANQLQGVRRTTKGFDYYYITQPFIPPEMTPVRIELTQQGLQFDSDYPRRTISLSARLFLRTIKSAVEREMRYGNYDIITNWQGYVSALQRTMPDSNGLALPEESELNKINTSVDQGVIQFFRFFLAHECHHIWHKAKGSKEDELQADFFAVIVNARYDAAPTPRRPQVSITNWSILIQFPEETTDPRWSPEYFRSQTNILSQSAAMETMKFVYADTTDAEGNSTHLSLSTRLDYVNQYLEAMHEIAREMLNRNRLQE